MNYEIKVVPRWISSPSHIMMLGKVLDHMVGFTVTNSKHCCKGIRVSIFYLKSQVNSISTCSKIIVDTFGRILALIPPRWYDDCTILHADTRYMLETR